MIRLLTIFLFLSLNAFSTTYYVKVAGGTGSGLDDANAWSYAKFNSTSLAAGDIVYFKRGDVFYGTFTPRDGTSGNLITYGAYGSGDQPKISGLTTLSTWTLSSGNIYYATLSFSTLKMVTVDAVVQKVGRYPNTGYLYYESHSGNTSITDNQLTGSPDWTGGEVVIRKDRYILDRHPITTHSTTTLTYTAGQIYGNNSFYVPIDLNGYFIQNDLDALDQHGEWYYDNAASRIYMYFTTAPSNYTVKAANIETAITNGSYINYNNIDFEGFNVGVQLTSGSTVNFNSCNFTKIGGMAAVYGSGFNTVTITGCTFTDCLNNGVWGETNTNYWTVTTSTFTNIGSKAGMGRSGDAAYIGICIIGTNGTITYNSVTNTGYNAIQFGSESNWLVQYNFVTTFCTHKDDGGGIYSVMSNAYTAVSNRVIDNNIVLNAVGAYDGAASDLENTYSMAAGIYLDDFTNHTDVTDNTVQGGDYGGIFLNGNTYNTVTGNVVYDFRYCMYMRNYSSRQLRNITVTGNQFIAKTATQKSFYAFMETSDNPSGWGTINSNYYARPIADNTVGKVEKRYEDPDVTESWTIAQWRTFSSQDAATLGSSIAATTVEDFQFDYNWSGSTVPITLTAQKKEVNGTLYSGSTYNLLPYTGKVLVYFAPAVTNKVVFGTGTKVIIVNGKVLIQ